MARKTAKKLAVNITENVLERIGQKETETPARKTIWKKVSEFWSSTPAWGAIGVLTGLLLSRVSRLLAFGLVGLAMWAEVLRVGFFTKGLWKWTGSIVSAIVIAVVLAAIWRVAGTPKEPPTLDQEVDAFAKKFPWLSSPPHKDEPLIIKVPSVVERHTHVEFMSVLGASSALGIRELAIKSGDKPFIPMAFHNVGGFAVQEPNFGGILTLIPAKDQNSSFHSYRRGLKFHGPSGTQPAGSQEGGYNTVVGPEMTPETVRQLRDGESFLCGFGAAVWKDSTGDYETDFSQCLEAEPGHQSLNWHTLKDNNVEHKLSAH